MELAAMRNVEIARILQIVSILMELVSLGVLRDISITCAKHVYTHFDNDEIMCNLFFKLQFFSQILKKKYNCQKLNVH